MKILDEWWYDHQFNDWSRFDYYTGHYVALVWYNNHSWWYNVDRTDKTYKPSYSGHTSSDDETAKRIVDDILIKDGWILIDQRPELKVLL